MTRVALEPIFDSYLVVAVLTLALVCLLWLRPRGGAISKPRARWLLLLRGLLVVTLVAAMLRPALVGTTVRPQSAVLLLLFDRSTSMEQPAAAAGASRWEGQRALLSDLQDELSRFEEQFQLRAYAYGAQLEAADVRSGAIVLPPTPQDQETDLSGAIASALENELGRRVAAIVVMGDGMQTARAPAAGFREVSRELARLDAPLYTVTFGPAAAPGDARDVAVLSMPDQYTVFANNRLSVEAAVRVRGLANKEIDVELVVEQVNGETTTLGPQKVVVAGADEAVPVRFPVVAEEPGEYRLTLRAAVQPGELIADNNQLRAFLTVLEGGLRVLYLYGELQGEQQLLRRSIDAAPDLQLDDQFVPVLDRERWPIDLSRWLDQAKYDAFLVESVDATAFSSEQMAEVASRVEQGMGFMMIGGYSSFGAGGFQRSPWAEVLPVEMGRFERQDVDPRIPISRDLHLWGNLTLEAVRDHPITRLERGPENDRIWRALPNLQGANRVRPKPAARVLLRTSQQDPVLIAGNYGSGRTLAFAGNTTSLWWRYGFASEHRRFWRQVVLWLAKSEDLNRQDVWIKLDRRRFSVGQRVEFTTGAASPAGEPLEDVVLNAVIRDPEGKSTDVDLASGSEGYGGSALLGQPGEHVIETRATRNGELIGSARARIDVRDEDLELGNPVADHQRMAQLADTTSAAGGRAVAPEEVPEVLGEIRRAHAAEQVEVEAKWQLGETAWSAWLLFCVMVALLTSEWVCRKRWGLV